MKVHFRPAHFSCGYKLQKKKVLLDDVHFYLGNVCSKKCVAMRPAACFVWRSFIYCQIFRKTGSVERKSGSGLSKRISKTVEKEKIII
jgi:hypothetical protein